MRKLAYKGYPASVDYASGALVIRVLDIKDKLIAECERPADVAPTLKRLVDNYLVRCRIEGRLPDAPPEVPRD